MKVRTPPPPAAYKVPAGGPATNSRRARPPAARSRLAKVDPTRTGTVRQAFARRLKAKFKALKGAVWQLVVRQDAFGLGRTGIVRLADNAFCATGAGGGIDPHCSPGGGAFAYPAGYTPPKSLSPGHPPGPNAGVGGAMRPALSKTQADAVTAYTDVNIYRPLNETLKSGGPLPKAGALARLAGKKDLAGTHEQLQAAFDRAPVLAEPVVLKRGVFSRDPAKLGAHFLENAGKVVTLPGYQSTSHFEAPAGTDPFHSAGGGYKGDVKFTIHAVHGLDVKPYSKFPAENEVLLNHASEYRVGRVEKRAGENGRDEWHVELHQLPPKKQGTTNQGDPDAEPDAGHQYREVRGPSGGGGRHPRVEPGPAGPDPGRGTRAGLDVRNADFAFASSPDKLAEFEKWLRQRFGTALTDGDTEKLWDAYLADGFKRGAGRAFDDVSAADVSPALPGSREADFLAGTRAEFLRSAFGRPETADKVKLIASRTLTDLRGVTDTMATRMVRALADGLTQGMNPRQVGDRMDTELDLGLTRADTIARTEFIRAHAEGQLDAFDRLGVADIGVEVEWATAGDLRVCPRCASMNGRTFTVAEAHGLIPAHPNCRCAFLPANVGERDATRNRTPTDNAFCPTGPGGGINPHCGSGGGVMMAPFTGQTGGGGASPGGTATPLPPAVHAQSGLQVGHQFTKRHNGTLYHVEVVPHGFQVSVGGVPQRVYPSLTAAAKAIRNSPAPVSGWTFFGVPRPASNPAPVRSAPAAQAPAPAPTLPATGAAVHPSGLPVGAVYTKVHGGGTHTLTVTPGGFQLAHANGTTQTYKSLTAAAKALRGSPKAVSGWSFFGVAKPSSATPVTAPTQPAPAPAPSPAAAPAPHVPAAPPAAPAPVPPPSPAPAVTKMAKDLQPGDQFVHQGVTHTVSSVWVSGLFGGKIAVSTGHTNPVMYFRRGQKVTMAPAHQAPAPTPAPTPAAPPAPAGGHSTIPFQKETSWATGDRSGAGTVLNGVPFNTAEHHYWEKVKDKDIDEPKPTKPIERAMVIIQEPDGRVWTVEPTNHFGGRRETVPGGTVEKGLTLQQNALKEGFEETGLQLEIVKHLGDIEDSNNGRNGRVYLARRVGGSPWDAKIEKSIIDHKTGQPAAESSTVRLSTPEHAASLLHRTDDQAMLALAAPIDVKTKANGNMMKKLVDGVKPAAKQYADRERAAGRQPGSDILHAVQELRGFNEKPTVVSKSDMDALVAKGDHIEMLRGVRSTYTSSGSLSAKDLADQFKTGTHFPGYGCFGNGTYADSNKGHMNVAPTQYGAGGDVIRMALPKTAKIIKQSELERIVGSPPSNFQSNGGGHTAQDQWLGMHAALAGYDAIHVDGNSSRHSSYGKGFYVILNRKAVVVQKESAKGHVIR